MPTPDYKWVPDRGFNQCPHSGIIDAGILVDGLFTASSGIGDFVASQKGYVQVTIDDVPENLRAEFREMVDAMSGTDAPARIWRKPDGEFSVMA